MVEKWVVNWIFVAIILADQNIINENEHYVIVSYVFVCQVYVYVRWCSKHEEIEAKPPGGKFFGKLFTSGGRHFEDLPRAHLL